MDAETLGQRTKRIIRSAGISPRILSAVTKLHFTTIYSIMRESDAASPNPITLDTLGKCLDKIEVLISEGRLPFDEGMSHDERSEQLNKLINAS